MTKPTDSPGGDSEPASAHPSLGKQNIQEDVEEDVGLDGGWLQFRSGSAINCVPLPSPGRNTPGLGAFLQDPCAEPCGLREGLRGDAGSADSVTE